MDPVELRKSLGMAEDASDEDVTAKIAELAARPEPKADDPPESKAPTTTVPDGAVIVDMVEWEETKRKADDGAVAASRMREQERDRFIGDVVKAGRLNKANTELRASLEREWDRDPETARKVAAGLAKVVHTSPTGHDDAPDTEDDALYVGVWGKDG